MSNYIQSILLCSDMLVIIFGYIDDGRTFKNILYTCKYFYKLMANNHSDKIYQLYNIQWSLLPFKNMNIMC